MPNAHRRFQKSGLNNRGQKPIRRAILGQACVATVPGSKCGQSALPAFVGLT